MSRAFQLLFSVGTFLVLCLGTPPAMAQPCDAPRPVITGWSQLSCSIRITWSSGPNVSRYYIYRSYATLNGNTCSQGPVGETTGWEFTDTTAVSGVQSYVVEALYDCGTRSRSLPLTCTTYRANPPAFSGFSASDDKCHGVDLTPFACVPLNTADLWRVWRATTPNFANAIVLAAFPIATPSLVDATAQPEVEYWYWMQPDSGACQVPRAGPVRGVARLASASPSALVATRGTWCGGVSLNWAPVRCADFSDVYRGTTSRFEEATGIASIDRWNFSYEDRSAAPGVEYTYWVVARAGAYSSAPSQPARGWHTPGTPPTAEPLWDRFYAYPGEDFAVLTYVYSGATDLAFQWRKDGVALTDNGHYTGATQADMIIHSPREADLGLYDVVMTSACGQITAPALQLSLEHPPCPSFLADYNSDGGVDGADVEAFIEDWSAAAPCADVNRDGGIDGLDMADFFICWEAC